MEDWGLKGILSDLGGIFDNVSEKYFRFEKLRLDHDLAKAETDRARYLTREGVFDDILSSLAGAPANSGSWTDPNAARANGHQQTMLWIVVGGLAIVAAVFLLKR